MSDAERAPTLTFDSSISTSPVTDSECYAPSNTPAATEADFSPEASAHFLWLQQAIVERIGSILCDGSLETDKQEASIEDLRRLMTRVEIGTLVFRSLHSFARHDMQFARRAQQDKPPVDAEL